MAPKQIVWVNDFDLGELGIVPEIVEGWEDSPSIAEASAHVPGRAGLLTLGVPRAEPREIVLRGVCRASSVAACRSQFEQFRSLLLGGPIELRTSDHQDRFLLARVAQHGLRATAPQFLQPTSYFQARLLCFDPYWYSVQPEMLTFRVYRTPVPVGTAPSAPIFRIGRVPSSSPTTVTISYRDSRGVLKASLTLTVTLDGTPEWVEVDCAAQQITQYDSSNVPSNGIDLMTAGNFFALDPRDADLIASAWPSLEQSNASCSAVALYRRAWL